MGTDGDTFSSPRPDLKGDARCVVTEVADDANFLGLPPSLEAAREALWSSAGLVHSLSNWETTGQSLVSVDLAGQPAQGSAR